MRCYPIVNKHTYNKILRLARQKHEKYEKIAILCTNGGYRVGDVLKLKKKHIWDGLLAIFDIKESKTNIRRKLPEQITRELQPIFEEYLKQFKMDDYIFPSSIKDNKGKYKHISYNRVYKVFKEIFTIAGIQGAKGTHTFRKTNAEKSRKDNKGDIRVVQIDLGHADIRSTQKYLDDRYKTKIKAWI